MTVHLARYVDLAQVSFHLAQSVNFLPCQGLLADISCIYKVLMFNGRLASYHCLQIIKFGQVICTGAKWFQVIFHCLYDFLWCSADFIPYTAHFWPLLNWFLTFPIALPLNSFPFFSQVIEGFGTILVSQENLTSMFWIFIIDMKLELLYRSVSIHFRTSETNSPLNEFFK